MPRNLLGQDHAGPATEAWFGFRVLVLLYRNPCQSAHSGDPLGAAACGVETSLRAASI